MTDLIQKAAHELGIESAVRVYEDHQLNPRVRVVVGTHVVESRIDLRWLIAGTTQHLRTILSEMHRLASSN